MPITRLTFAFVSGDVDETRAEIEFGGGVRKQKEIGLRPSIETAADPFPAEKHAVQTKQIGVTGLTHMQRETPSESSTPTCATDPCPIKRRQPR